MTKDKLLKRNKSAKVFGRKHVPLPTGHFQIIGCRDFMVGFTKKGGVLVRLYYPAADQSKRVEENYLVWPNWLPHENYRKGYGEVGGIRNQFLLNIFERISSTEAFIPAVINAKPLRRSEPFPVVVFSHGLGCCRTSYSAICLELASHGFVVAAVEHRDNSACLSFYAKQVRMSMRDSNPNFFFQDVVDGDDEADFGDELDDPNYIPPKALSSLIPIPHISMEWVRYRSLPFNKTGKKIYTFRNKQIHQRVRECSRALDLLEALQAGYELNNILDPLFNVSEFEGLLDLNKAIVMGHSFGGSTAIMSAAAELRFKAVVCLDAWMYPIKDESVDLVSQPALFINSKTFEKEQNMRKLAELLVGQSHETQRISEMRKAFTIKGSTHYNFCDVPFVFSWLTKFFFGVGSSTNPFTVHDIAMALSLDFIEKNLDVEIDDRKRRYLKEKRRKVVSTFRNSVF